MLATVVGYILVAIIAYFVLRTVVGPICWLLRAVIVLFIIGGLFTLYLSLKTPRE